VVSKLEQERERRYIGLPEFAQVAARILSQLALEQERGTVTMVPDERTIRYYLSEGLIQAPEEKQGTASVFGYLQLLQLVAIKKLQSDHFPIRKIRDLVADKTERQLETLLGVRETATKRGTSEAKSYLESLLTSPAAQAPPLQALLSQSLIKQQDLTFAGPPQQERTGSWQRVEIEPGLELHIHSDYTPPTTSAKARSLAERIRTMLKRYSRKEPSD